MSREEAEAPEKLGHSLTQPRAEGAPLGDREELDTARPATPEGSISSRGSSAGPASTQGELTVLKKETGHFPAQTTAFLFLFLISSSLSLSIKEHGPIVLSEGSHCYSTLTSWARDLWRGCHLHSSSCLIHTRWGQRAI